MSAKRTDILQIRKYLNGELDAAAMHKLEREAMDDPFLMDALEGYEANKPEQHTSLAELEQLLQQRINKKSVRKIIPWKYYAAAASVLLFLMLGYWVWNGREQPKQLTAANETPTVDHVGTKTDTKIAADKSKLLTAASAKPEARMFKQAEIKAATPVATPDAMVDTVTKVPVAKTEKNAKLEDLLKKMQGFEVDANGSVTHQGQSVTKVKINGKDYAGDMKQPTKNLPADIIEKVQMVDDYGDQAARTGIKKGSAIQADTVQYAASPYKVRSRDSVALKEISIAGVAKLNKKDISLLPTQSQTLKGKVIGVDVTIPPRISGVVLDQLGLPLAGVSVIVDGTTKSAFTNSQGKFSIPAKGQATLNVNYIGYESAKVKVDADDSLQIKLKPAESALNEVVVTGYGQAKPVLKAAQPRIGWAAYNKYLKQNAISKNGEVGTVSLSFTIAVNGDLSDFKIINSATDALNKQAINLIQTGPAWYGDSSSKAKVVQLKVKFAKR